MNKRTFDLTLLGCACLLTLFVLVGLVHPIFASDKTPQQPHSSASAVSSQTKATQESSTKATQETNATQESSAKATEESSAKATQESSKTTQQATPKPDKNERDTFVSTWAERIDAFNAGYPLEGFGRTFAEAAYDNKVDPRLAPAIARIESGSGENCFLPYNAWGWDNTSWDNWDSAIRDYVAAFTKDYGTELTHEMAESYREGNADEWYSAVSSFMSEIWESNRI